MSVQASRWTTVALSIILLVAIAPCLLSATSVSVALVRGARRSFASSLRFGQVRDLSLCQQAMTEMFAEFLKLCQKHAITFFVVGGTLLGAEVWKGWIPWDGDIDIEVLSSDWARLEHHLTSELPVHFWLQTDKTDPLFSKHRRRADSVVGKLRHLLHSYDPCFDGAKFHNGLMLDLNLFHVDPNRNQVIMPDDSSVELRYDDVFPLQYLAFEYLRVPAPRNSRKYLEEKYGPTYWILPNAEERHPHEGTLRYLHVPRHHHALYPDLFCLER